MPIFLRRKQEVPFPEVDDQNRSSFIFTNGTGARIHDLTIDTDLTSGVDPDMVQVQVFALGDQGEKVGTALGGSSPNGTNTNFTLNPPVNAGQDFQVDITFNGPLESDEKISFKPSSDTGGSIIGAVPVDGAVFAQAATPIFDQGTRDRVLSIIEQLVITQLSETMRVGRSGEVIIVS